MYTCRSLSNCGTNKTFVSNLWLLGGLSLGEGMIIKNVEIVCMECQGGDYACMHGVGVRRDVMYQAVTAFVFVPPFCKHVKYAPIIPFHDHVLSMRTVIIVLMLILGEWASVQLPVSTVPYWWKGRALFCATVCAHTNLDLLIIYSKTGEAGTNYLLSWHCMCSTFYLLWFTRCEIFLRGTVESLMSAKQNTVTG